MKENLHQEIQRLEVSNNKLEKKLRKTVIVFPLVVVFNIALLICLIYVFGDYSLKAIRSKEREILEVVPNGDAYDIASSLDMTFFEQKTVLSFFEDNYLGNTNDRLINGGKIYSSDSISLLGDSSGVAGSIGFASVLDNGSVSYINVIHNNVYYRDDSDNLFYFFNAEGSRRVLFNMTHVGQTVVYGLSAFFINLDDGHTVYYCDLDTGEIKKVFDYPVLKFAVAGRYLLMLTSDLNFIEYDFCSEQVLFSIPDVTSFAVSDGLYIQRGNIITQYTISMSKRIKEYSLTKGSILVSVSNNNKYIQNADSLKLFIDNPNSAQTCFTLDKAIDVLRGVYDIGEEVLVWVIEVDKYNYDYKEVVLHNKKPTYGGSK